MSATRPYVPESPATHRQVEAWIACTSQRSRRRTFEPVQLDHIARIVANTHVENAVRDVLLRIRIPYRIGRSGSFAAARGLVGQSPSNGSEEAKRRSWATRSSACLSDVSAASRRERCSSIAATIRRCSFSGGNGNSIAASFLALTLSRAISSGVSDLAPVAGGAQIQRHVGRFDAHRTKADQVRGEDRGGGEQVECWHPLSLRARQQSSVASRYLSGSGGSSLHTGTFGHSIEPEVMSVVRRNVESVAVVVCRRPADCELLRVLRESFSPPSGSSLIRREPRSARRAAGRGRRRRPGPRARARPTRRRACTRSHPP